ncbi:uncharacterized protein LOC111716208 [Eurytemora carolleeae]|uniref:uncharacterized protein LOC111716208 n=1 Tax=Eurytemora carolleeae TaxID=1294199 RepID=UPI000C7723CD|nr:uncharacterized protein LOC111716208 [Eurytemora carolleeae]|eukprot:XP_023347418.1 uncharacterized protein LOC111716208 [Eurytemora affinis]
MEHIETELWNAVQKKDIVKIQSFQGGRAHQLIKDWPFVETCVKEAIETGDWELVKALLLTFCHENSEAFQVGEFAIVVSTSLKNKSMMTNILEFWFENNSFQIFTPLDVVAIAIQASGPIKSRKHSVLETKTITHLIETAIYVATVDKSHEVLKHALQWYRDNKPKVMQQIERTATARRYANKIQDFNSEFNAVADKCEQYAIELLTKCTTKHEIQTLLQTKSYKGHHNANFNIAILDGHKELVAHEKFQQLLHKKWGQRDRVHYADDIRFNIFWSEMGKTQKLCHFLKQIGFYLLLPLIFLITTFLPCLEKNELFRNILMQSHVPVNRFLYFELSKVLFNLIIFCTLIDEQVVNGDLGSFAVLDGIAEDRINFLAGEISNVHNEIQD